MSQIANRDEQYYEELLATAAFGTLTPAEAAELRVFLAANPAARAALNEMRELVSNLPLLADEAAPSPALRDRIEQSITGSAPAPAPLRDEPPVAVRPLERSAQPEPTPLRSPARPAWRNYVWAAAAALVIAFAGGALLSRVFFDDTGDESTPETIAYEMDMATPAPEMTAELTYDPDQQLFMLSTENMPHAPEGQVYQVWLIDKDNVPQPKGVMDEDSFAVTADMDQYAAFAITVEPGPLGSEAPTSQPFFVAPLTPTPEGT